MNRDEKVGFHRNPPEIMQSAISDAQRASLLAYAVPALSAAAGHIRCLHSDMKDAAYFYVHPLYDNLVETGGLK